MPKPIVVSHIFQKKGAEDARDLFRIVYFSASLIPPLDLGGRREILDILNTARTFNKTANVTGALTYNEFHFAQVLEGSRPLVEDLYSRIWQDRRHERVITVEQKPVCQRDFTEWSMAYVGDLDDPEIISSNVFLQDILANPNAAALLEMMKYFLRGAMPED